LFGTPDNSLLPRDQNWSLKELLVLHEDIYDRLWIAYEIVRIELKLLKFRILTNEVLYWIFEDVYDFCECGFVGWCFNIENDFMINS